MFLEPLERPVPNRVRVAIRLLENHQVTGKLRTAAEKVLSRYLAETDKQCGQCAAADSGDPT